MGVRGLTTYITNNEKKFLKPHKLHNCTVLLDGNSIAANLFIWSNIESVFGGDYDKFAKYVKEFFKLLQKCDLRPIVLFDGGYEQRKLKTVYTRLRDKFKLACQAQPFTGSLNFPLFMRIVFREVLVEMEIPFAQSDFEADDELAALARQLKCPVLSYDSDFYIYDVLYIPLPSINLIPVENKKNTEEGVRSQYHIECKIYSVDRFIQSFGGLDKSMLPLLAALLGNDYIKRSVFKKFYTNLKIPKGKTNHLQRRIKAVIEWLRHETFESAVHKILSRMRKNHRRYVKRQLKRIVNGYLQCTSILSEYLGIDSDKSVPTDLRAKTDVSENPDIDLKIVNIIEQINVDTMEDDTQPDDDDDDDDDDDLSLSDDEECSDEDVQVEDIVLQDECIDSNDEFSHTKQKSDKVILCSDNTTSIPCWLLDLARRGRIQSCVFDILSLQQYFFPPQVEDYSLPPAHLISLKILNAIVGLLHGENGSLIKYWTRSGSQLTSYYVEPVLVTNSLQFPRCENILGVDESIRKAVLLDVAEVDVDLTNVPEDWHLFLIAVIFWLKNMTQPAPSEAYLHTMIMCLVAVYAIDSSVGVYRNRQTFMRKYRNFLNKVIERRNGDKPQSSDTKPSSLDATINETIPDIRSQLDNVSNEDCVLMFETVLPYHHVSEQIKMKPRLFCLSTVHAFAQFQSSLFHLAILNSTLGFPLSDCVVSKLFSGTFAYNIFQNFSKRNNITAYVETLLRPSPSLLKLYMMLSHVLLKFLNNDSLVKNPAKSRRKKKKESSVVKLKNVAKKSPEEDEGEVFVDENNRFSGLCINES